MTLEQENEMLKDQLKRMEEERDHNYRAAAEWKEKVFDQQEINDMVNCELIEEIEKVVKLRNAIKDALDSLAHNDEFSNPAATRTLQDIFNETK